MGSTRRRFTDEYRRHAVRLAWIFRAVSDDGLMWLRCAAG